MTARIARPVPCIVLAGGLGTRLRSVVADVPKCLAPVGQRTFLDLLLDRLFATGITQAVLSLGHMADKVLAAVNASQPGRDIRYVVEPAQLGTGGAIALAMDSLDLDEALVANGDTFLDGDLGAMLMPLRRGDGELFRMATVQVPDRNRYGGVEIDAQCRVQRFLEKGRHDAGSINAGLYRLARAALPAQRPGSYSLEAEVLPALAAHHALWAQPLGGGFIDIGVPDDYFRFCAQHGG